MRPLGAERDDEQVGTGKEHLRGGSIRSVSATVLDEPETRGLADWNRYAHEMIYMPTIYSLVALQTAPKPPEPATFSLMNSSEDEVRVCASTRPATHSRARDCAELVGSVVL